MTTDRLPHALETIGNVLLTLGSAVRAAGAVNIHRTPAPEDLAKLGISADAYEKICRY